MEGLDIIKKIVELIQSKKDIKEIEYDDKNSGRYIKVKRNIWFAITPPNQLYGKEIDKKEYQ